MSLNLNNKAMEAAEITTKIANMWGVSTDEMFRKNGSTVAAEARFVYMFYLKHHERFSLGKIGQHTGGHSHATVLYGLKQVNDRADIDQVFYNRLVTLNLHQWLTRQPGVTTRYPANQRAVGGVDSLRYILCLIDSKIRQHDCKIFCCYADARQYALDCLRDNYADKAVIGMFNLDKNAREMLITMVETIGFKGDTKNVNQLFR